MLIGGGRIEREDWVKYENQTGPSRAPESKVLAVHCGVGRGEQGVGGWDVPAPRVSWAFVMYTGRRRVSLTVLDTFTSSRAFKQTQPGVGGKLGEVSSYKDLTAQTLAW